MSALSSSAEAARATTERLRALWGCPRCTYANPESTTKCEICELPKPSEEVIADGALAWNCAICTFENKPAMMSCEMCGTRKDEEKPDPRSSLSESRRGLKLSIATKKLVEETPIVHLWKLHGIRWKLSSQAVTLADDGSKTKVDETRHMAAVVGMAERVFVYGGTHTRGSSDGYDGFVVLQRDANIWEQSAVPRDAIQPPGRLLSCAHQTDIGIVVFGGFSTYREGSYGLNDLWIFEPITNTWTQLDRTDTRGISAPASGGDTTIPEPSSASDGATAVLGASSSSSASTASDVIGGNAVEAGRTEFIPTSERPPMRGAAASAIYSEGSRRKLLVFGGCSSFRAGGGSFKINKLTAGEAHNDLFEFDFSTDLWRQLHPVGAELVPKFAYATGDIDEEAKCFYVMGTAFTEYKRLSTPTTELNAGLWMYSIKSNHWWKVPLAPDMEVRVGGRLVVRRGWLFYFETLRTSIFWAYNVERKRWYKMSLSGSPSREGSGEPYFSSLGRMGGTLMFYVSTDMTYMSLFELSLDDIVATLSREFRPTENLRQDLECLIDHELYADVVLSPKAWCGLRTISAHHNMVPFVAPIVLCGTGGYNICSYYDCACQLAARGLDPDTLQSVCEESSLGIQDYQELLRYIYLGTVKTHSKEAASRLAEVALPLGLPKLGKFCNAVAKSEGPVPSGFEEIDEVCTLALYDMAMPLADICFVTTTDEDDEDQMSVFRYDMRSPPTPTTTDEGAVRYSESMHKCGSSVEVEGKVEGKGKERAEDGVGSAFVERKGKETAAGTVEPGDGEGKRKVRTGPADGEGMEKWRAAPKGTLGSSGRAYLRQASSGTTRDLDPGSSSTHSNLDDEEESGATFEEGDGKGKARERYKVIKAHKNVLLARSTFFQVMLKAGMREVAEERILTHFSYDVMASIIEYLYTGETPRLGGAGIEPVLAIFEAAHMYELAPLVKLCVEQLKRHMDKTCVLDMYMLAEVIDVPELAHAAIDCIRRQYHDMEGPMAALPEEVRLQMEEDHLQGQEWTDRRCCVEWVLDHTEDCIDRLPAALSSFRQVDFQTMSAEAFAEVVLRLTGVFENETLLADPSVVAAAAQGLSDHFNYATIQLALRPDASSSEEDRALFRTKFQPQISEFAGMSLNALSVGLHAAREDVSAATALVNAVVTVMDVSDKPLETELAMAELPGRLRRLADLYRVTARKGEGDKDVKGLLATIEGCLRRIRGS